MTMHDDHDAHKHQAQAGIKYTFNQSRLQLKQQLKPGTCVATVHDKNNYHS